MEEVTVTRENLYQNVWSTPLTQLAKEYKISDARLKEMCLTNNIPLPQVGHWSKIRHGKKIKKTPLNIPEDRPKNTEELL